MSVSQKMTATKMHIAPTQLDRIHAGALYFTKEMELTVKV